MRSLFKQVFGNVVSDNSWYLCAEVFWASIYASGLAFAGLYAIRLGATDSGVSLLSSLPALTAAVVLLPIGQFLQSRARPSAWILSSLLLARAGTLLYIVIPWLRLGVSPGSLFVACFIMLTLPNNFFNLGFVPFLAKALPESQRADTFAARNVLTGAVVSLSTFLLGLWLNWIAFPVNYQAMFLFGFAASMLSMYYLGKVNVQEPPRTPAPPAAASRRAWRASFKQWLVFLRTSWQVRPFRQITLNTFLYGMGLWASTPLLLLYFVRHLGASEGWLGALGSITNLSAIFGYLFWQRVIRRWGELKTLQRTIPAIGLYPLLAGISPSLTPILFAAGLNGIFSAAVNLTHLNTFLKSIPEDEGHNFTALHQTLMNVGAFICPLIGIFLADRLGFAPVLVGCGILAILGGASFSIWPIRVPPPPGQALGPAAAS